MFEDFKMEQTGKFFPVCSELSQIERNQIAYIFEKGTLINLPIPLNDSSLVQIRSIYSELHEQIFQICLNYLFFNYKQKNLLSYLSKARDLYVGTFQFVIAIAIHMPESFDPLEQRKNIKRVPFVLDIVNAQKLLESALAKIEDERDRYVALPQIRYSLERSIAQAKKSNFLVQENLNMKSSYNLNSSIKKIHNALGGSLKKYLSCLKSDLKAHRFAVADILEGEGANLKNSKGIVAKTNGIRLTVTDQAITNAIRRFFEKKKSK
jgi:hypothetical protein